MSQAVLMDFRRILLPKLTCLAGWKKPSIAAAQFVLLMAILWLNLHIRWYPAYLPQLRDQAEQMVRDSLRQRAADSIGSARLGFNAIVHNRMVRQAARVKEKTDEFMHAVDRKHESLADPYQGPDSHTYLVSYDAFQWLRYTKDILDHGYPGHIGKNGVLWDTLMLAPRGFAVPRFHFLFRSTAFLYRVHNLLLPDIPIQQFCFMVPLIHTAILLVFVFLFCRRHFSAYVGLLAMLLAGFTPAFVARTMAGAYDMDALCLIFPLAIIWLMTEAARNSRLRTNILYALAAGLMQALFAYSWPGWYFSFGIVVVTLTLQTANIISLHWHEKREMRNLAMPYVCSLLVFGVSSALLCMIIAGYNPLRFAFHSVIQNIGLGKAVYRSIWPRTYYTVKELVPGDFVKVTSMVHGTLLFFVSVGSMAWLYVKERRTWRADVIVALILWFAVIILVYSRGSRFAYFLSVPSAIFISALSVECIRVAYKACRKTKHAGISIVSASAVLAACAIVTYMGPYKSSNHIAYAEKPSFNDEWEQQLTSLARSSPHDAIVAAWWDYGSWIKEVGRRKVLFDGHSQNTPVAYWMGRFFSCTAEVEAVRILRMLANASDDLYGRIEKHVHNPYKTTRLMQELTTAPADTARAMLASAGVPDGLRDTIIQCFYMPPSCSVYVLVNQGMKPIAPSITYLGNWEFSKVCVSQNADKGYDAVMDLLRGSFGLSSDSAANVYLQTVAALGPKEHSEVLSTRDKFGATFHGREDGLDIVFHGGLLYDQARREMRFLDADNEFRYARFVYLYDSVGSLTSSPANGRADKRIIRDAVGNSSSADEERRRLLSSGYLIIPGEQDSTWQAIELSSSELGQSMLVKLLVLQGKTLSHFRLHSRSSNGEILVFKADLREENLDGI